MNRYQQTALDWHCRLSVETMHPRFARRLSSGLTVVLTVNSGYEWIEVLSGRSSGEYGGFGCQVAGPAIGVLPPGPVWHCSVAGSILRAALEREAERQLLGVGDAPAGEWRDWSGKALHIRRRLTGEEQRFVGGVADIRGSDEARMRAGRVAHLLRLAPPGLLADELAPR